MGLMTLPSIPSGLYLQSDSYAAYPPPCLPRCNYFTFMHPVDCLPRYVVRLWQSKSLTLTVSFFRELELLGRIVVEQITALTERGMAYRKSYLLTGDEKKLGDYP